MLINDTIPKKQQETNTNFWERLKDSKIFTC